MSDTPELSNPTFNLCLSPESKPHLQPRPSSHVLALSRFLSRLVFEERALRGGIEITLSILLFYILRSLISWQSSGASSAWGLLMPWFFSCGVIALADFVLAVRPLRLYRRSMCHDLFGAYDEALRLLDCLRPEGKSLVFCPAPLYHWRRSRILTHAGRFQEADIEIQQALKNGLSIFHYYLSRAYVFQEQRAFEFARRELELIRELEGEHAIRKLEEGFLFFKERDLRRAKKAFEKVLEMPAECYLPLDLEASQVQEANTVSLARAFLEATRLWTGEAEKSLPALNRMIEKFQAASFSVLSLRPFVASLLVERAHYLATHKEPKGAVLDLKLASHYCCYSSLEERMKKVQEELEWRFKGPHYTSSVPAN